MTDLQLLDKFCDECMAHIDPFLLNDVRRQGLTRFILDLPNNTKQAKAVIRARMAQEGRYIGDPEIEEFADKMERLKSLRQALNEMNLANSHDVGPILDEMTQITKWVSEYYR